jgi:hypothetical protein
VEPLEEVVVEVEVQVARHLTMARHPVVEAAVATGGAREVTTSLLEGLARLKVGCAKFSLAHLILPHGYQLVLPVIQLSFR